MTGFTGHRTADVIIIGAGSIGAPTAYFLAKTGLKVKVIDAMPSVGQASNKHAIGGIRATHSDPAKILLGNRSLNIFSHWAEDTGDDIEWRQGGYSFVAYEQSQAQSLSALVQWQQSQGLPIQYLKPDDLLEVLPHLNPVNLLGGTYSPEDGSASPLMSAYAFHKSAVRFGADFHFNETVQSIACNGSRVTGLLTDKESYSCDVIINAAGGWADQVSQLVGVPVPVEPDSHEAAITEPVQPLFKPMVVDMRARPGSANFYFYQHPTGKIIYCMTPDPLIPGNHTLASSDFLPKSARRLVELMPVLRHIRVRRVWRGTYPNTPDGSPIIGKVDGLDGYLLAVGMCGQGFMFGPGVATVLTHLVNDNTNHEDDLILKQLSIHRQFEKEEILK